jgi:ribose transport system substrate-binding protein
MIGCAPPSSHDRGERFVFIATNTGLPYWKEAEAGFLDAANSLGVKGELVGPTGYQPSAELGVLKNVIEEHPAGICISAARPEIFQADIDNAIAQGIPVICVDSDVPRSKRIAYVGTDNFKAGKESMRRMSTLVSGKSNIVVVSIEGQNNVDQRLAGAADALTNYPALKITKILDDKGDPRSAADQISDLIQKKEKIDGIICLEASGGSGAAEAVHRFNLDGKLPIVAFDDDPATLDWIDKGVIAATVTQKPYVMSYYGLKLLDDLHHNAVHQFKDWHTALAAPVPTFVDTGTVLVDKTNTSGYREALAVKPRVQ